MNAKLSKGMFGGITKISVTGTITHTTSTDMVGIANGG